MTSVHPRYDVRIFLKECVSLSDSGYDVSLLCADNNAFEEKNGVKIISVYFKPGSRISRIFNVRKTMLKKALELGADIYHFHDPELLPLGYRLKKCGKKVIYDAHEDVPRQICNKSWIPKYLRKIISWSFERYENYIVRRLDHIITATPYIAERFQKIFKKVTAISNYPILAEFDQRISWSKKDNECCYIGGLTRNRGIRQIVEAAGLAKVRLNLCGKFESENFEEEIRGLPGFKYVKYYGLLDRESVKKILCKSKIGIITFLPAKNHINAQPNKMFEYMAAGIPVISSDFPLWKRIIEDNNCGTCVNPYDVNAISDAIQYFVFNENEAKKMGGNGRRLVENEMNWEGQARVLCKAYKEL
jgi:glycosyltransferase involved in cell wall biosynthesis